MRWFLAALVLLPQDAKQKALNDLDVAPEWIYDDLPAGLAQAKKTGKPLLVVFR
jgi:hypothetical protein